MYAVFKTGGKQHRVSIGQTIRLEKLNVNVGETIEFSDVLMIKNEEKILIGQPYLLNKVVKAEVISQGRGEKIKVIKFRRRKHYRKQLGHRQRFTEVKILNINFL